MRSILKKFVGYPACDFWLRETSVGFHGDLCTRERIRGLLRLLGV